MKTFRQYLQEASQPKHPIFKDLVLPGGKDARHDHEHGTYRWRKHGGYNDAVKKKLMDSLPKAKWKEVEHVSTGNADGSVMGGGSQYRKGEHVLSVHSTYGGTKHDNSHYIEIQHKP